MSFIEWLRVVLIGIVEGVTEWLPVSSTGHLILFEEFWNGTPDVFTKEFLSMFDVIIQLGAILAVLTVFFHKLNPISAYKTSQQKKNTWQLWGKVVVATLPAVVFGLLLDDWMDEHLYNAYVVAAMLILYGIAFIVIENIYRDRDAAVIKFSEMPYKTAFLIGCFQILALVPGTSRSGVTILGALILGCSRYIATEFTFFLAIPVMFGAGGLKLFKYLFVKDMSMTGLQWGVLAAAMAVAYVVSLFVIKFLLKYVKRHDFKAFGVYRIVLGAVILVVMLCVKVLA